VLPPMTTRRSPLVSERRTPLDSRPSRKLGQMSERDPLLSTFEFVGPWGVGECTVARVAHTILLFLTPVEAPAPPTSTTLKIVHILPSLDNSTLSSPNARFSILMASHSSLPIAASSPFNRTVFGPTPSSSLVDQSQDTPISDETSLLHLSKIPMSTSGSLLGKGPTVAKKSLGPSSP
jgi:hypothetical protein